MPKSLLHSNFTIKSKLNNAPFCLLLALYALWLQWTVPICNPFNPPYPYFTSLCVSASQGVYFPPPVWIKRVKLHGLLWNPGKTLFSAPANSAQLYLHGEDFLFCSPHGRNSNTAWGALLGIPITCSVFFFFLSKHDFAYTRLAFCACSPDDFGPFSTLILSVALGVVSHLCISEKRDLVNRKTIDFPLWFFLPWQSKSHWKTALIEHDGLKNRALTVDISVVKLGIMLR